MCLFVYSLLLQKNRLRFQQRNHLSQQQYVEDNYLKFRKEPEHDTEQKGKILINGKLEKTKIYDSQCQYLI